MSNADSHDAVFLRGFFLRYIQCFQKLLLFISMLSCTFLALETSHAQGVAVSELAGIRFSTAISADSVPLVLNGLGLREATIFKVDVYVAALYVENDLKGQSAATILDSPAKKRLVLHFLRDVDRESITDAWDTGFAANTPNLNAIANQITSFNAEMRAMKEGETMTLTFSQAGVSLEFGSPDAPATDSRTFSGSQFARAVLAIWLGKNPPNAGLKQGLLSK
jgi:hypothetical protein